MSSLELRDVERALRQARGRARRSRDVVHSGEWLGLIGPNGAGKSSLLRAVVGLVDYDGRDRSSTARSLSLRSRSRRAALVAYVPQEPLMPDDMTGFEYVLLGRSPYVGYFGTESRHDQAMAADVLERLDLERFADRRLGDAQRRRAAAARDRPGARPGGADPAARRADQRARHRPPAAGARARRPAAPRPRADGDLGDARPDAGRHVQRPPGAAARGHRRRRAARPPTCCGPRRWPSSTACASPSTTSPTARSSSSPAATACEQASLRASEPSSTVFGSLVHHPRTGPVTHRQGAPMSGP